jgi:sulfur carrier protein ThiS
MRLKLSAAGNIGRLLPRSSHADVADGITIARLLTQLRLPTDRGYLVSVNNQMVSTADYADRVLKADDEVMLLPTLKGG